MYDISWILVTKNLYTHRYVFAQMQQAPTPSKQRKERKEISVVSIKENQGMKTPKEIQRLDVEEMVAKAKAKPDNQP